MCDQSSAYKNSSNTLHVDAKRLSTVMSSQQSSTEQQSSTKVRNAQKVLKHSEFDKRKFCSKCNLELRGDRKCPHCAPLKGDDKDEYCDTGTVR